MLPIARGIYSGLANITRNSRAALHTASALRCKAEATGEEKDATESAEGEGEDNSSGSASDPKDRSKLIPVETSIRYLKSAAYKQTYGEDFVWTQYRYAQQTSWGNLKKVSQIRI